MAKKGETIVTKLLGLDAKEIARQYEDGLRLALVKMTRGIMELWDHSMQNGDSCCVFQHNERTADYAFMLAQNMGWSKDDCVVVAEEGMIHDMGKLIVPPSVLNYPERLDNETWERYIIPHPKLASDVILHTGRAGKRLSVGVAQHHERWRGGGYTRKLRGKRIHPDGRVLALADCFDAATNHRPYEKNGPKKPEDMAEEIREDPYGQFDPKMRAVAADCFPEVYRMLDRIGLVRRSA